MTTELRSHGQVAIDQAGVVTIAGLVFIEEPHTHRYPPAPPSAFVEGYLVGGTLVAAALGLVAFVVLRHRSRGGPALRRLAGALVVGVSIPMSLVGAGNAGYFGAPGAALTSLAVGFLLVWAGARLLRRN